MTISGNKGSRLKSDIKVNSQSTKRLTVNSYFLAELNMQGNDREVHAKTPEVAQEEVLTCIGIHLYERFQKIAQAMRHEEQTWQLLYYASVLTLRRCFELEFEKRQGFSDLDLICAELLAIDESTSSRKELKRNKRKLKRSQLAEKKSSVIKASESTQKSSSVCKCSCDENEVVHSSNLDNSIDMEDEEEEEDKVIYLQFTVNFNGSKIITFLKIFEK